MVEESVHVDGEHIQAIQATAQETKTYVSIGISEKTSYSCGTLFNSNLIIGPDGRVLNHHRKIMPTYFEKLTWAHGDGHGLNVVETPFGKIGNLICGENTNPLARYALMAQGEELHISTWPAVWPTRIADEASNDVATDESDSTRSTAAKEDRSRNYDNVAANRTRAAAHCFEAKAFGVLCSGYLDSDAINFVSAGVPNASHLQNVLRSSQRGATMFLDPTGAALPGFTIDNISNEHKEVAYLQNEEGILYADLDLSDCVEGKQFHDVVGGYQRPDIFELKVNRTRQRPAYLGNLAEHSEGS